MSYHVFFGFSTGLAKPIRVPIGTLKGCLAHVAEVERILGYEANQYRDNPRHWRTTKPKDGVSDELFCATASRHNRWVRSFYYDLEEWSKTILRGKDSERLTPKDAARFWHGLQTIEVPPSRWTSDYYRERMEHLYEVMRGRESEGVTLNAKKPLSERQAAAVVTLFSEFFTHGDQLRLDVPNGHDHLASSYDGGYDWCEKCGPISCDDVGERVANCRRRGCPIKKEFGEEYGDIR